MSAKTRQIPRTPTIESLLKNAEPNARISNAIKIFPNLVISLLWQREPLRHEEVVDALLRDLGRQLLDHRLQHLVDLQPRPPELVS